MKKTAFRSIFLIWICTMFLSTVHGHGRKYQVSVTGNDHNTGSIKHPFRTIQHAAQLAEPGDIIMVHAGTYRERVDPVRGGTSEHKRIIYEAAGGEQVIIKGSEQITGWQDLGNGVWTKSISNRLFDHYNPYKELIEGDWFEPLGRLHHTGAVYIDGQWLQEAPSLDAVLNKVLDTALDMKEYKMETNSQTNTRNQIQNKMRWFAKAGQNKRGDNNSAGASDPNYDQDSTRIWVRFNHINPNQHLIEINVRQTLFYPSKTGINYITVRGFIMQDAATPWAPPTAEQIGLIGPHWSKGWIIENNIISHSSCSGISLGKYGDRFDNQSGWSAEGYVSTIKRALKNGWNKENIGHHIIRNNLIYDCEQAGIVGSMGCAFSTITGNEIHDIHVQRLFSGYEMAGIKLHGAVDVTISHNHIYHTTAGIWLDWMAQGTRISGNLLHDNREYDLFFEVDHGPFLVDNNIFLSEHSQQIWSSGGAYVQNLIAGSITVHLHEIRETPYLKPHSTEIAALKTMDYGDFRYYNNIFTGNCDLSFNDFEMDNGNKNTNDSNRKTNSFNTSTTSTVRMSGNLYLNGAKPASKEINPQVFSNDPRLMLIKKADSYYLHFKVDKHWMSAKKRVKITTGLLGYDALSAQRFERPDGSSITLNRDYFNKGRHGNAAKDFNVGPFANLLMYSVAGSLGEIKGKKGLEEDKEEGDADIQEAGFKKAKFKDAYIKVWPL